MPASCPEGLASDTLMRYAMPVGPLNQPYGMDCLFSALAYDIIAGITASLAGLFVIVLVVDLKTKRGWLLKSISMSMTLFTLSLIITLVCGWVAPTYCRVAFAVSNAYLTVLWHNLVLYKMATGNVALLRVFSGGKSSVDILGGRRFVYAALLAVGVCQIVVLVGSTGAAATYNPIDESTSFVYFQAFMVGFAVYAGVMSVSILLLIRNFLRFTKGIDFNARIPSTHSNMGVDEFVRRFERSKQMIPLVLPMACGLPLLHAFVLPMLSLLMVFHVVNGLGSVAVLWYALTGQKHRQRVWTLLFTCGWQRSSPSSSSLRAGEEETSKKRSDKVVSPAVIAVQTRPNSKELISALDPTS